MTKTCNKCKVAKPLSAFAKAAKERDGLQYSCRECAAIYSRRYVRSERGRAVKTSWRERNPEKAQAYFDSPRWAEVRAAYSKTEGYRETVKRARAKTRANGVRRAYWTVQEALRAGRLAKQPCARCGADRAQAHHEDYSRPLDVVWLCVKHHAQRHREIRKAKQGEMKA